MTITATMYPQLTYFLIGSKDVMLPCLNKKLFGMECPGCGLQRSALLLFEGEFVAAFKMYPAIYPLGMLFSFLLINNFARFKYGNMITIVLSVLSVSAILINYFYKLLL
ncbi:DUF2752 domain-containing protein [Flagellimonas sp. 2504JD4-2]